jgi:Tfp pilus assembly protein PilF
VKDGAQKPAQAAAATRWAAWAAAAALAALVLAVFLSAAGFEFSHYDDGEQVVDNPFIRSLSPANIAYIFTHFCITSYYPVRLLSFAIDYAVWGAEPRGYHLTNVLIHVANVLLVFWLMLRLARGAPPSAPDAGRGPAPGGAPLLPQGPGVAGIGCAAVAAAVFAVHPVVVEPVAWIPGREELLMTLFAVACLHFHHSARLAAGRGPTTLWHALAAAACALAAMSNAVSAVIPLLVLTYDVAFARLRSVRRIVAGSAALWAIAAAAVVLKVIGDGLSPAEHPADLVVNLGLAGRLLVVPDLFRQNLMSLVWPKGLTLLYPQDIPASVLSAGFLAGLGLMALAVAVLWLLRRRGAAFFGVAWFLLAMGPTSQVFPHVLFRADRYLYLPLAGLSVAVAAGLWHLAARGRAGRVLAAAGLLVVAALAVTARPYVGVWHDGESLFRHCAQQTPEYARARVRFGALLLLQGRYDEAASELAEAVRLSPMDHDSRANLGLVFASQGRTEEALQQYRESLRLKPDQALVHANCATALLRLGRIQESIAHSREALRIQPDRAEALNALAMALLSQGQAAEAIGLLRKALAIDPRQAAVWTNLGMALVQQGDLSGGASAYEEALRVQPDFTAALRRLAWLRATVPDRRLRNGAEAVRLAERLCELTARRDPVGLEALAAAYAEAGRPADAAAVAREAIALARSQGRTDIADRLTSRLPQYDAAAASGKQE